MSARRCIVAVAAAASTLAGACTTSDTESVRSFAAAREQLSCALAARCCSPAVTSDRCEANLVSNEPLVNGADDAVTHGFATFDRARAESCLAELRKADCATPRPRRELDPCTLGNTTFGTIPVGGACSTPGDNCAEGTFCHVDSATSNGNGHCANEVGSGESCADARCRFGLICNAAHVCGAPLPDGAQCDPLATISDCASDGCSGMCTPSSTVYFCAP